MSRLGLAIAGDHQLFRRIIDAANVLGAEAMALEHLVGIDAARKGPAMVAGKILHPLVQQCELFAHALRREDRAVSHDENMSSDWFAA